MPETSPLTGSTPVRDQTSFALVTRSGRLIAGDPVIARLGRATGSHYHDTELQGQLFRVTSCRAHLPHEEATFTVAQPTTGRETTIMPLLMRSLWPNILQIVTTLAIIFLGVRRSLRPWTCVRYRCAMFPPK